MAKPKRKRDDKSQKERFIEKAREVEADESGEAFERALKKIIQGPRQKNAKPLSRDQNR
jgi:hypothetical protein